MGFDGLVQLISVDGQRTVGCPYWELVADVDAEQLRDLYRDMVVVRRIDAEAMALQRQGELGLWAPLLGQEAAQVGSARALRPDDFVFPSYREHGVAYCRGVDPVAMLRLWRGTGAVGLGPGRTRHRHAGHRRRLAGAARHRVRARASPSTAPARPSLTYFGDGATSEGDVAEAFGFAASFMRAGRLLLPEQPVGHLRASPAAVARLDRPARARATASRASRSTATTCWPSSPPPGSPWPAPRPARGRPSSRP